MDTSPMTKPPPTGTDSGLMGWALPVAFLLLAGGVSAMPRRADIPLSDPAAVDRAALVVQPRRVALTDPPLTLVEGQPENCNACHQVFKSQNPGGTVPTFHSTIKLVHGLNDRCVNCHDPNDRERLTLRDAETVAFSEAPQLCAQCHGTVFRDWERGTHGKTLGSWMKSSPAHSRLACNQCHDPHAPKYPKMEPLPGPSTLRMGDQSSRAGEAVSENSLQRWLRRIREERATPKGGTTTKPATAPRSGGGHP
ncbi:MAG: cytochrome c3 family protein [Phycisphaerae bacterium]|nr:cytochrome c3 family protein [Phycisphaerae bacterium]